MATANIKNFELKIGKTGLIVIVVGMSALLCASFLFGVDVGKNIDTYPAKIALIPQRALALVWKPAKIKLAQNYAEDNQSSSDENIDLTYHKTLTGKSGKTNEKTVDEEKNETSALKNDEPVIVAFHKEPEKSLQTLNDKGKTIESNKDKSVISSEQQRYIVQAASLKEKKKAAEIGKKIAVLGYKTETVEADIKGKGIVFRVIVSGFENKAQAEEASQKISKKLGTKCIIRNIDNDKKKN
jgi:cell division protein FtsN